jgi:K+-sensing histidine kinase KdpD
MRDERDVLYAGLGPLAAILIGMALVPFRGMTTASNFTFVFMALVILVSEWGGRAAALLTAVTAALSLNFFLTAPYLRLTIHGRDDILAFVGLGACGLLAAALGSDRSRRTRDLEAARRHLDVLHTTLGQLEAAGPVEPALTRVLNAMKAAFPLVAAVVRDERNHLVAASDTAYARPVPQRALAAEAAPPADGGRLALVAGNRQVGWLDVWGDTSRGWTESRHALSDVGRLIAVRLASESSRPAPA